MATELPTMTRELVVCTVAAGYLYDLLQKPGTG